MSWHDGLNRAARRADAPSVTAPTVAPTRRIAPARARTARCALLTLGAASVLLACGGVEIDHSLVEAAGTTTTVAAPATTSTTAAALTSATLLIPTPPTSAAPFALPSGSGSVEGAPAASTPTGGYSDSDQSGSVEGATPIIDNGGGGGATTATTTPPTVSLTVLQSPFGLILVDVEEHTLYASATEAPDAPTCIDACAQQWVPIDGTTVASGYGIDPSLVGSVTRPDGIVQLTYGRRPIYRLNNEPIGVIMGQGDAATWYVVDGKANLVTAPAA